MELTRLRYFAMVARLGNITKAAEKLNMAQPPLSHQISLLEKKLGVKLFERHKRGMYLTNEGLLLLEQLTPILEDFDRLKNFMRDVKDHTDPNVLTIATLTGFMGILSPALHHLQHAHPNIRFIIHEGVSKEIIGHIENKNADIGIIRLPVNDPEINFTMLGNDIIRAFIREDDPLSNLDIIEPTDLRNRLLLLIKTQTEHSGFTRIVQFIEESGTRPRIVAYSDTVTTILQLVYNKVGIGLIPHSAVSFMPPGVKMVPFGKTSILIPTAVVWHYSQINSLVLEAKDIILKHCTFAQTNTHLS